MIGSDRQGVIFFGLGIYNLNNCAAVLFWYFLTMEIILLSNGKAKFQMQSNQFSTNKFFFPGFPEAYTEDFQPYTALVFEKISMVSTLKNRNLLFSMSHS